MRASKSIVLIVPSVIWIRREAHKPQIKKINAKPPPAPKAKNPSYNEIFGIRLTD